MALKGFALFSGVGARKNRLFRRYITILVYRHLEHEACVKKYTRGQEEIRNTSNLTDLFFKMWKQIGDWVLSGTPKYRILDGSRLYLA